MATILVVDDYRSTRQYLVTLLGDLGHRLLEATDGVEALAVVRAERPDLIIADIVMPTMDGYEFVRHLCSDPTIAQTPVIFYTGVYIEHEAETLARAYGAFRLLTKPFSPEVLLSTLEAALDLSGPTPPPSPLLLPEEFDRQHLHLLTHKLAQKVNELEAEVANRKQAEKEAERRWREAEIVAELARSITASLSLDTVLRRVVEGAKGLCNSDTASIALREAGAQAMVIRHNIGVRYQGYESIHIESGKGIGGLALATGRPWRTEDYAADARISREYVEVIRQEGLVTLMAVPILIGDRVEGMIYVANRGPRPFTDEEERILLRMADHAAIAIANARLYQKVRDGRARLQSLSRRLVQVQEAERRAIARELHDEVGQHLTGLKLLLDMGVRMPINEFRASLGKAQGLVNDLMGKVRELSLDLRPSMLDDLGLLPALLWQFERYTAQTKVRVILRHTGLEQRFAPEVETAAYRQLTAPTTR